MGGWARPLGPSPRVYGETAAADGEAALQLEHPPIAPALPLATDYEKSLVDSKAHCPPFFVDGSAATRETAALR